jgi:hypothetical protein
MVAARWRWALVAACALVGAAIVPGRAEGAAPALLLVGPRSSRLADLLARELAASGFSFVRVENRGSQEDLLWGASDEVARGVFVGQEDRWVVVLALRSGESFARLELPVGAQDDLNRRRVCLTVVEYLRVLVNTEAPAPPAPHAVRVQPAPARPAANLEVVATPILQGIPTASSRSSTPSVAVTLDHNSALGASTGYLQLSWQWVVGARVGVRARGEWPLWGAERQTMDGDTRMWTFGGGVGLHYFMRGPGARLRPYVSAAGGVRLLLTEFSDLPPLSRATVTPSVNLGGQAGLAYRVSPYTQIFFESGAARHVFVPLVDRASDVVAAANAISLSSSLGVTFEY